MTVACYNGADAKVATALALLVKGSLIDLTGSTPTPPPHTLDLYFTD